MTQTPDGNAPTVGDEPRDEARDPEREGRDHEDVQQAVPGGGDGVAEKRSEALVEIGRERRPLGEGVDILVAAENGVLERLSRDRRPEDGGIAREPWDHDQQASHDDRRQPDGHPPDARGRRDL